MQAAEFGHDQRQQPDVLRLFLRLQRARSSSVRPECASVEVEIEERPLRKPSLARRAFVSVVSPSCRARDALQPIA
jgi:hypothetical protein